MSGTSMDGVDVAIIETDGEEIQSFGPAASFAYSQFERQLLLEAVEAARSLSRRDDRSGVLAIAEKMVTDKHVESVNAFAAANAIALSSVDVIGFHGQTVIHRPEKGFTVQLGLGAKLFEEVGVPVVFDFREADMAEGGQGAPLVPIFHRALALRNKLPLPSAFVNIGGIANVTFVADGNAEELIAFDAGPGNCLLDDWAMKHTGKPVDLDAHLALAGTVNRDALQELMSHPFFIVPPPKSLDRNFFSLSALSGLGIEEGAATLTALTVAAIASAARWFPAPPSMWIITGGGARNPHMLEGLRRVLGPNTRAAEELGLNADFIEAQAFAYLAARKLRSLPSSFPKTTGTKRPAVLGILIRAGDGGSSSG